MTVVVPRASRAAASLLFVAGCAGAADTPQAEPAKAEPATAPQTSASSSAEPAPSASSDRPAPAAGSTRIAISLPPRNDKKIGVTIDVPQSWGIEPNARLGPSFQSCRSASDVLGNSISVVSLACDPAESKEACLESEITRRHEGATKLNDPDKPKVERWIESEKTFDKGGGPRTHYTGEQYLYDTSAHALVRCGYFAMNASGLTAYRDACRTLALDPVAADAAPLGARDPSADGEIGNASDTPHGAELAKAAAAFHAAVAKGDAKAAASFGMVSACERMPAAKRAACKSGAATEARELEKNIGPMKEAASKIEPAGFLFMPLSEKSDVPVFLAYPVSRESACKPQMELAWPILWIEGGPVIGFAAKKAEPKKAPPKNKK